MSRSSNRSGDPEVVPSPPRSPAGVLPRELVREPLARAEARIGQWLDDKYRLDRVLGVGGMAVVYAATHRNGRRFAIKILHPELSIGGDLRARFLREGYVANRVGHPGAVMVLDDDVAPDGSAFLVMELLDGSSLEAIWESFAGRVPLRAALGLTCALLDVLAAAHASGVVHRDIKPGNVFVTKTGTVKVLDFGIARFRHAEESVSATRTGMMLGTPAFMSPEQALGRVGHIDARSDVWSVGATLFALLSGRMVHEAETTQELIVRAATAPAPRLGDVAPEIAKVVTSIVDRALAFDASERWAGAREMQEALTRAHEELFGSSPASGAIADLVRARSAESIKTAVSPGNASAPRPAESRDVAPATAPIATRLSPAIAVGPSGSAQPVALPTVHPDLMNRATATSLVRRRGVWLALFGVLAIGSGFVSLRERGEGTPPTASASAGVPLPRVEPPAMPPVVASPPPSGTSLSAPSRAPSVPSVSSSSSAPSSSPPVPLPRAEAPHRSPRSAAPAPLPASLPVHGAAAVDAGKTDNPFNIQ